MENGPIKPTFEETLLAGMIALPMVTGLSVLLIFTGHLFITGVDCRLKVRAHAGTVPDSSPPNLSGPVHKMVRNNQGDKTK